MKTKSIVVGLIALIICSCSNEIGTEITESNRHLQLVDMTASVTSMKMSNLRKMPMSLADEQLLLNQKFEEALSASASNNEDYFKQNINSITNMPLHIYSYTKQKYLVLNTSNNGISFSSTITGTNNIFYLNTLSNDTYKLTTTNTSRGIFHQTNGNSGYKIIALEGMKSPWKMTGQYGHSVSIMSADVSGYALDTKTDQVGMSPYLGIGINAFTFELPGEYQIKDLQFVSDEYTTVTKVGEYTATASVTNTSSKQWSRENIVVDTVYSLQHSFIDKNYYKINIEDTDYLLNLPTITDGDLDFGQTLTQIPYKHNSMNLLDTRFTKSVPVNVRPRTRLTMECYLDVYKVETDYIATVERNGKTLSIRGRWTGQICVMSDEEPDFIETNLDTNESKHYNLNSTGVIIL